MVSFYLLVCFALKTFRAVVTELKVATGWCTTGFIAMYATLASRDVDCCLIPESPFYLEGEGGLLEFIEKRIKENGHMVIVLAEGAGQELMSKSMESSTDASGNKLLKDVGLWLSQSIKVNKKITKRILYAISENSSQCFYFLFFFTLVIGLF